MISTADPSSGTLGNKWSNTGKTAIHDTTQQIHMHPQQKENQKSKSGHKRKAHKVSTTTKYAKNYKTSYYCYSNITAKIKNENKKLKNKNNYETIIKQ